MSVSQNGDFLHLMDALPADVKRRSMAGDIDGALRLIEGYLASGKQPELAPRLRAERLRLSRLERNFPYDKDAAIALVREEWPEFTPKQFDALVDAGRIDWRYVNGEPRFHSRFVNSLRFYPTEAPGLKRKMEDHTARDEMLARMEERGELSADITLHAHIRATAPSVGKTVQAWLPIPAACPQQDERNGEERRRKHYFGNLDPCRMVANSAFQAPLAPPDPCNRSDPYDNQLGEMTVDGVGLGGGELDRDVELVDFKFL